MTNSRHALAVGLAAATLVLLLAVIASGVVGLIYVLIVTESFSVVVFPGPVIGVIIGVWMLGLGVAKGIRTTCATALTARS